MAVQSSPIEVRRTVQKQQKSMHNVEITASAADDDDIIAHENEIKPKQELSLYFI